MTKSKQIIAYKEANPTHKPSDVAKACGVATAYVYQVLHKAKNKAVKKPKLVAPMTPTEGQKIVREELNRLNKDVDEWMNLYFSAANEADQLKQDAIGYRAVISYLQGQLDGVTV
jgi:hypothetical protein